MYGEDTGHEPHRANGHARGSASGDCINVPRKMRDARRWLVWKLEGVNGAGKPRKVPYYTNARRRRGKLDTDADLAQFATFDEALRVMRAGGYDGVGFALGPDGNGGHWQGADLDNVEQHPEVQRVVAAAPGYVEVSPSGRGWHVIGYGREFDALGSNSSGVEVYSSGRFFTFTGRNGYGEVEDIADFVEDVLRPLHKAASGDVRARADHVQGDGERVVDEGRHDDLIKLAARMVYRALEDGVGRDAVVAALFAERARGRWTRDVPDDEILRAVHGAFDKYESGDWDGPVPEAVMGCTPSGAHGSAEADRPEPAPNVLPPCPAALNALPGRMGEVQGWAESIMLRPHAGAAGLVTFALVDYLAMAQTRVDSRQGLAMGELFLILAPTAFGKESLRLPFRKLAECCARERIALPDLHYNAPASQQGLHEMLMASRSVCMLSDEFGDWVAKGEKDQCREQCMAYMMHVYGNPFGTVVVPNSVTRKYTPVEDPRLAMFCTSTTERFSEVINGSLADRGFLNRFVILPVGSDEMELNGDLDRPASAYEIPAALRALAVDISRNKKTVTFDADAKAYRNDHFRAELDPLAQRDGRLAGRLNEQSLRMAAGLALADGRHVIGVRDLAMAYEIREGLYALTAAMFDDAESLSANHPTVKALNQLRKKLTRVPFIYRSQLGNHSRVYSTLDVRAQDGVVRALADEGAVKIEGAKLRSLIFVDVVDSL